MKRFGIDERKRKEKETVHPIGRTAVLNDMPTDISWYWMGGWMNDPSQVNHKEHQDGSDCEMCCRD